MSFLYTNHVHLCTITNHYNVLYIGQVTNIEHLNGGHTVSMNKMQNTDLLIVNTVTAGSVISLRHTGIGPIIGIHDRYRWVFPTFVLYQNL